MSLCAPFCGAHCPHPHHQEVESSLVALRNQKLKEERDAQQKAAKKSALPGAPPCQHTHMRTCALPVIPSRCHSPALVSALPAHSQQRLPRPSPS